jgi:ABC-type sugar transport system ATPase subunit
VLALDEPTRGVDVRAKAQIHAVIGSLAAEGTAVLLVSSDLPELLELSDRVLVLRRGRVVDLLPAAGLDEQALLLAASGAATMAEGVA